MFIVAGTIFVVGRAVAVAGSGGLSVGDFGTPDRIAYEVALVVLFCGVAFQIGRLVLGPPRDPDDRRVPPPERFDLGMATAIVAAVVAIVSAFYLPASMLALIHAATQVVWGGL